jgi:hypothetical protein
MVRLQEKERRKEERKKKYSHLANFRLNFENSNFQKKGQ